MYTSIFKVALEYKEMTGGFPLASHLLKMTSVSFKVVIKVILYVLGKIDILHKPSGHGHSGKVSIKLTMIN